MCVFVQYAMTSLCIALVIVDSCKTEKTFYNGLNVNMHFCIVFNKHLIILLSLMMYNCWLRAYHNTGSAELWLWYIIAPVKLIAAASTKTGIHQPCEAVTNSAVSGPHRIPGTVAIVFETANVIPA